MKSSISVGVEGLGDLLLMGLSVVTAAHLANAFQIESYEPHLVCPWRYCGYYGIDAD
jgi:hypothetical protein